MLGREIPKTSRQRTTLPRGSTRESVCSQNGFCVLSSSLHRAIIIITEPEQREANRDVDDFQRSCPRSVSFILPEHLTNITMEQPAVMNPPLDANNAASSVLFANERNVVRKAGRQAISEFLATNTCFSVLRASGKVVVFDIRIPIQLAFYALVEHGALNESLRCDKAVTSFQIPVELVPRATQGGSNVKYHA